MKCMKQIPSKDKLELSTKKYNCLLEEKYYEPKTKLQTRIN